jgi:hypothetical protein
MKHVAGVAFLCTLSLGLTFLLALRQPARFEQHPIWTSEEDPASHPNATLEGRTILLHPSEATFLIPQDWVEWHDLYRNNLHLSHKQLDGVALGAGNWHTEFANVTFLHRPCPCSLAVLCFVRNLCLVQGFLEFPLLSGPFPFNLTLMSGFCRIFWRFP